MPKAKKKITEKHEYTASEIVQWFDDKQRTQSFIDLETQMETDFDLFSLKEYEAEKGHQSYTSPKPKNDFLKVFTGINKASLTWQIVTPEDAPETDRDAASKGEQILTGILSQADEQLSSNDEPTLREGFSWFGCGRGAAALKCLIYNDDNKETVIDIQPLDPLHMAWEKGNNGYSRIAFEYTISKTEAEERYSIVVKTDTLRIIDYFDRKNNAVVLVDGAVENGSQFVKEMTLHGLDHPPVWLGFAGGLPTVYNKNHEVQLKQRAQSVYASSRGIYEPYNKQISFIADTAEKSVAGTLGYWSEDGKKSIQGDPFGTWQVVRLALNNGNPERLEAINPPRVPPEAAMILGAIDRDMQQSTVPFPAGYGLDPGAHSGTALAMLNDNTRSIYDPFASLVERGWKWLCKEILLQFKAKGQKLNLKGFNQEDKFFSLDANPADIQDDWYIKVRCEPKLPRDEAGELQMALAATQPRPPSGRPLISNYTALEKIVKLQNPDAEDKRIEEQMVRGMIEQMPTYQIRKMAQAMVDKGDIEGAKEFLASVPAPQGMGGGQQQPPQPAGQPMPGAPGGQPGAGQPLSPQEIQQLMAIAEQMQAAGRPVPQEIQMALQMAQQQGGQMPQQQGAPIV